MIICARDGCEEAFQPATHNQKYHNAECCRIATNARIMERYYAERDRRLGVERRCKNCSTKLSRYNESDTCNSCSLKQQVSVNTQVANMLLAVSVI